ncbi:MAG: hypothetical protein M1347_02350, partial [Chloroflexi bacterium]|nr:hypothetical protein [Chloroflexota bacterium]
MKPAFLRVLTSAILLAFLFAAALPAAAFADEGTPPPTEEPAPPPDDGSEPAPEEVASDPVEEAAPSEEIAPETVEEAAPSEEVASDPIEDPAASEEIAPVESPEEAASSETAAEPEVVEEPVVDEPAIEDPGLLLSELPEGTEVVVLDEAGEPLSLASEEAADLLATGDPIWCPSGMTPAAGPDVWAGGCSPSFLGLDELEAWLYTYDPTVNGVIWIEKTYADPSGLDLDGGFLTNMAIKTLAVKGGWTGLGTATVDTANPSEVNDFIWIYNWANDVTLSDIIIDSTDNTGLYIDTSGKVTLTRVDATNNDGHGAYIENTDGTKDVMITDGEFTGNGEFGGNGLVVYSKGAITLANVIANENWEKGALLVNCAWDDVLGCTGAASAKPVTLTSGAFEFNYNGDNGLEIYSGGAIMLKDMDVIGNAGSGNNGLWLDNTAGTGIVSLTGTNVISENAPGGLVVFSNGAVTVNNLVANSNGSWSGAYIDNSTAGSAQPVTLTGFVEAKFNGRGLHILSNGVITLNNVNASNNTNNCEECGGAYLRNDFAFTSGVSILGTNIFNDNGAGGLTVWSKGVININNLTANGNSMYCVLNEDDECDGFDGGDGAYLDNHNAVTPMAVTITVSGGNTDTELKGNEGDGIQVLSKGAISLSGVVAWSNGYGGYLDNWWDGAVGGISFTGWGASFSYNDNYGLEAYSKSAITVAHLYAWGNGGYGAYIENMGNVTFSGDSSFGDNGGSGLEIASHGAISLNTLYAARNAGIGVDLYNAYEGISQNVNLTGASYEFQENALGLVISSFGTITIANINAHDNGDFGAVLDNCLQEGGACWNPAAKTVTLTGDNTFERNEWTGLDISSKGSITINNVIASDNGGFGAYLDNQWPGAVGAVNVNNTPTYWPEFSGNGMDGLTIYSNGAVTVKDLDAYDNGWWEDTSYTFGYGVYINTYGNVMLGTSRSGWWNSLSNNFLSGLEIYTSGTVTLSNLTAWGNGWETEDPEYIPYGYGAYIWNADGVLKAVTLNSTNGVNYFADNASGGLYIYTGGAVTLNNVEARDNGIRTEAGDGVHVDTCLWNDVSCDITSAPQAVNVKGNNVFENNWNNGLSIQAKGAITVNNIDANYNGDGAELYNWFTGPSTPQNVTLTGYGNFFGNYNNGLDIQTYGTVLAANLDAEDNGQGSGDYGTGVYIDNYLGVVHTPKPITLTGNNYFGNNWDGGLEIHSLGAISLANFRAWNNWFGVLLDNNELGASGGVTFTGTGSHTTNDNWTFGLDLSTLGAININISDMWANDNGSFGWHLDNHEADGTPGVTMTSPNPGWAFDFYSNGDYGLWIESKGNISITGLDAT